jgi:hypothetical protein
MAQYRHRDHTRQMRDIASAQALSPLQRVWRQQLTGVPAKFAPHEVHRIPKTKCTNPVTGETHNGFSDASGE